MYKITSLIGLIVYDIRYVCYCLLIFILFVETHFEFYEFFLRIILIVFTDARQEKSISLTNLSAADVQKSIESLGK